MKGRAGIAGNPVLIGAATVLVVLVAVFLAYNANKGLPFVPTYQLRAEVPSAANLVVGNDVRIGGSRVGFVDGITRERQDDGTTIAMLDLTLERDVSPLPRDSTLIIRPRSALGLKYVEITRGTRQRGLRRGGDDPDRPGHADAGRVRRGPQHVRRGDARRDRRQHDRLRRRLRRPRRVDQHGDRRVPAAAARRRPGGAEPRLAGDQPAPLLRRAGRRGGDRGARRRDAGRAVRQPRHHLPRAARGRAAVHPGLDHRRRARARHRDPDAARSSGRSCATPSGLFRELQPGAARCAVRADDRRRARGGHPHAAAHAALQPPPRLAARRAPGLRRGPAGPQGLRATTTTLQRSTRRWRSSPRRRPSATT